MRQLADLTELNGIPDAERKDLENRGLVVTTLESLYNWGRKNSIWPLQFGLACCAIEMICAAVARHDIARFGAEVFRPSPRQADLMIVAGTVTRKMAPQVVRLYNQMPEPKWVMAMGACAISGGPFKRGYNVLGGIDRFVPVDVHVPGCPPRPEALLQGLMFLQERIGKERTLGKPELITNPGYGKSRREYPVPRLGAHGLEPSYNPVVWPPKENPTDG